MFDRSTGVKRKRAAIVVPVLAVILMLFSVLTEDEAGAANQGGWLDAGFFDRGDLEPSDATMVREPDDSTLAVWLQGDLLFASERPSGGEFSAPSEITVPGLNPSEASSLRLVSADNGTVALAWRANREYYVSVRPPEGEFGAARLSPIENYPELVVATDGTVTAVWTEAEYEVVEFHLGTTELVSNVVRISTMPPGGTFTEPTNLSAPDQIAGFTTGLTTAPDGTTTVTWIPPGGANQIRVSDRPPGGSFGPPVTVVAGGGRVVYPKLVYAPDGSSTLVWFGEAFDQGSIFSTTRLPGGSFQPVVTITDSAGSAADLAISPDGTATVAWTDIYSTDRRVRVSTRPPGGSFGNPVAVSPPVRLANSAGVEAGPDGTTFVLWGTSNDGALYSVSRSPGGSFSSPATVNLGIEYVRGLTIDDSGTLSLIRNGRADSRSGLVLNEQASGASFFSDPEFLGVPVSTREPHLSMNETGATAAVWVVSGFNGQAVWGSFRTGPPEFDSGRALAGPVEEVHNPQAEVSRDETWTAAWSSSDGGNAEIRASVNGGAPVRLSDPETDSSNPRITSAADGDTTVVWQADEGTGRSVQFATRPKSGSFSPPAVISSLGIVQSSPQVSASPDGTTIAVWTDLSGGHRVVRSSVRPPGGQFSAPATISDPSVNSFDPRLEVNAAGSAIAVWRSEPGSQTTVNFSSRPTAGSFTAPVAISAGVAPDAVPEAVFEADGMATVIWTANQGGDTSIVSASRPAGTGTFNNATRISATEDRASDPDISSGSDGTTTVVWQSAGTSETVVRSSTRKDGAPFGTPRQLPHTIVSDSEPEVAVAPSGRATAIWRSGPWIRWSDTAVGSPPPICTPRMTFGKVKRNKRRGFAFLPVKVNMAGPISLRGISAVPRSTSVTSFYKPFMLKVKARGKRAKVLRKKGRVQMKVRVTFGPSLYCAGQKLSATRTVWLAKSKPKKRR